MSEEKRELDNLEKQIKDPKTPEATRKKLTEKYRKLTESIKKREPVKAKEVGLGKGYARKIDIDQGPKPSSLSDTASGLAKAYGSGRSGFEGDYEVLEPDDWWQGDIQTGGDPDWWRPKKHGGRIKKSKKRKRAALRGYRAELRGG